MPIRGYVIVYSVHYSDINGLSRLENNILAHEISEYFGKTIFNNNILILTHLSQEEVAFKHLTIHHPQ
jgi:hypothetical protein